MRKWSISPLGDSALLIAAETGIGDMTGQFVVETPLHEGAPIQAPMQASIQPSLQHAKEPAMQALISRLVARLESCRDWLGYCEYVPAYTSVALHYNPWKIHCSRTPEEMCHTSIFDTMAARVREALLSRENIAGSAETDQREIIVIPVLYGGKYGPDLEEAARHAGIAAEEMIAIHSSVNYLVHMIGFAPGFPYLGGLPPEIAVPRKAVPRQRVPAGSIGIGGVQTGVYPIASPGGWQLIGMTPIKLFRPHHTRPSLLQAGDLVRFKPISDKEFQYIDAQTE